jgi:hypothetical protein
VSLALDHDLFSKGEFARRRNVTPGRLSQWLSEGKISGDAIVGEGRNARIRESVACRQLKVKLEPMQMTGNGLSTRLEASEQPRQADTLPLEQPAAPSASDAPPSLTTRIDSVEEKIKLGRLEQIERQNREGRRQEAVAAGRLTDADEAKAQAAKSTVRLVAMFEGALSDFATAIAGEFKLPQRDVLHLLRTKFRDVRAQAAGELKTQAEALPTMVGVEIEGGEAETETD